MHDALAEHFSPEEMLEIVAVESADRASARPLSRKGEIGPGRPGPVGVTYAAGLAAGS